MVRMGVRTVICTDISKDGAMHGTNLPLYRDLIDAYDKVVSGFANDMEDVQEVIFVIKNYGGTDKTEFMRLPGAGAKRKGHQGFPSSLDSNLSFIATLAAGTAAPSLHRRTALRKGNGYRFSWVQKKGGGGLHRKKGRAALLCRPCTRCIVKPQRA